MKHLIFHVYPKIGGTWRDSIEGIRSRIDQFDGRRIFGVVSGDGLESCEAAESVRDMATTILQRPNDAALREVVTLAPAIEMLATEPGAVFFAHSKGSTHSRESVCQDWREAMLETCLDFPDLIDAALDVAPIVGPFRKMYGLGVGWHFSGSFWWLRLADYFRRPYRFVQNVWYGVETFPACNFWQRESRCLFLDACKDLYDENYWRSVVRPALSIWRERMRQCTAE